MNHVVTEGIMGKGKTAIVLFLAAVGALLAENNLDFPLSVPWFLQHTGGVPILDMLPFRDADKTNAIIATLGEEGRRNHLYLLWTIDLALPLLFGACLYLAIAWGAANALPSSPFAWRLRLIGVAAAISDYVENVLNTVLLAAYPTKLGFLASLSGPVTLVKFVLYGISILIAVVFVAIALARRTSRSRAATPG